MKKFEIKWTDLAKAFAVKCGGLPAVEEQVRGEIAELEDDGLKTLNDLMFHVVEVNETNFICTPLNETTLQVDTASYEEMEKKLDKGPLAGFSVSMPIADSEDR